MLTVVGNISMDKVGRKGYLVHVQGGAAMYSSLAASTVGSGIAIVSRIGGDYPREYLNNIKTRGIDVSGIKQVFGEESSKFDIVYNNHFHAEYCGYRINVNESLEPEDIPKELIEKSDLFHICPNSIDLQIKFIRRLEGRKLSIDNVVSEIKKEPGKFVDHVLPHASFYFPNREESMFLREYLKTGKAPTHEELMEKIKRVSMQTYREITADIAEYYKGILCVKCDANGVFVSNGSGEVFNSSAFPTKVIDPTGAGDSFAGAFLAKYAETGDTKLAAVYGNAVASLNIRDYGPARLLKLGKDDVRKFVASNTLAVW